MHQKQSVGEIEQVAPNSECTGVGLFEQSICEMEQVCFWAMRPTPTSEYPGGGHYLTSAICLHFSILEGTARAPFHAQSL